MSEFRRKLLMQSKANKPILKDYFTIVALEDGLTAKLSVNACEYCVDGNGNWKTLPAETETETVNSGQKIQFKITNPNIKTSYGIGTFTINKKCNVEGNIMSLLYGDNFEGQTDLSGKNTVFFNLFRNCTTLQNAENLILPATTLASSCYYFMFSYCTSLTSAPELPATTLADRCYQSMFLGCNSLTTAPELPATTLAGYCYANMFSYCTSLVEAPELPATTLALFCYAMMFDYCISLTEAPELPATTLANYCYREMFRNCSKLNYIKMLATDISAEDCLYNWVDGVASTGTFIKNKDATWNEVGVSGVPEGWTRKIYDGVNEVIDYSYEYFTIEALEDGIVSILWRIGDKLYYSINNSDWIERVSRIELEVKTNDKIRFKGNQSENIDIEIKCNVFGNIMSLLFEDDFQDKTSLAGYGDYVFGNISWPNVISAKNLILPATTLSYGCYSNMFSDCTSLTEAPDLPATTLADRCYSWMFYNCTSLTTAPQLPATTLALFCYFNMFYGTNVLPDCSNIDFENESVVASGGLTGLFAGTKVTDSDLERILPKNDEGKYCLPVTTLANLCYHSMFSNCTSLIEAPELPATTLASSCYNCYSNMFNGCSNLNYIKMLATNISEINCLSNWVSGVAAEGTFVKSAAMTSLPSGVSGIPEGWTVENA